MPFPTPSINPSPSVYPSSGGPFTDLLQQSLASFTDPAGTWTQYLGALGAMFENVFGIVVDQGDPDSPGSYQPGWGALLDPDQCPGWALPYLAQFTGATIPPGSDAGTARGIIRAEQGWQRGTPGAIVAAAKRNLTGSQSVALLERTPNAYSFQLVVKPSEVMSVSQLTAAVNAVKPAGLTWTLTQTNSWTVYQMEAAYGSVSALEAAFQTVTGLENDQVGA